MLDAAARSWAPLQTGEVHVYRVFLDAWTASRDVLTPDELQRAETFRFSQDRERFVRTRSALRHLLGHALDTRPGDVPLAVTPAGKPYVALSECDLTFNVAHSEDVALIALARGAEVGVDVEHERVMPEAGRIAELLFHPSERAALAALPEDEYWPAFYRTWARREAVFKALGTGLGEVPHRVEVAVGGERQEWLRQVNAHESEVRTWLTLDLEPARGEHGALAVRGGARHTVRVFEAELDGNVELDGPLAWCAG